MQGAPDHDLQLAPDEQVTHILSEARMILPGLLSLLGLQIMSVFDDVFHDQLSPLDHALHFVALLLLAIGVALVMTPAAYHRQIAPTGIPRGLIPMASRCVGWAMLPLLLAICIDIYLVGKLALADHRLSVAVAVVLLLLFVGMWGVFPTLAARRHRRSARAAPAAGAPPHTPR